MVSRSRSASLRKRPSATATWRTEGTWHDWPGDLSVNFDGWRFLRYPIDGSSTELNISPSARWSGGRGSPVFPIRLRGFYVVVNRQALDPTEMREVPASYYLVFFHPPFDFLKDCAEVMDRVEALAWNFDPAAKGFEWNEEACPDYQRHYPEVLGYEVLRPVRKK